MSYCKWFQVCPMKYYSETGKIEKSWIEKYCKNDGINCVRYDMEEKGKYHPDWMMPNGNYREDLK